MSGGGGGSLGKIFDIRWDCSVRASSPARPSWDGGDYGDASRATTRIRTDDDSGGRDREAERPKRINSSPQIK